MRVAFRSPGRSPDGAVVCAVQGARPAVEAPRPPSSWHLAAHPMTVDPVKVAGVSARLHALALGLWSRGVHDVARAVERESKLLAAPSYPGRCKTCEQAPVPRNPLGRP